LREFAKSLPVTATIITRAEDKWCAYAASSAALAKSGTATLELALAEVPMVVTYKVNPMTAWILKRMIHIKFVNLINILQNKQVIPERLQEDCTPEVLSKEILLLLSHKEVADTQVKACRASLKALGLGKKVSPSQQAAKIILG
jgi:lipid-A-disaccharide synthase